MYLPSRASTRLIDGPGVISDASLNGAALYIEGGRAWDIEPGLDRSMPQWFGGEKETADWKRGQIVLGTGENWQKKDN